MPRIVVQPTHTGDLIAGAFSGAGRAIQRGIEASYGAAQDRDRIEAERARAEAQLLREQARAEERAGKVAEREADREAVARGLEGLGRSEAISAARQALQGAVKSPGGALGPFGAFNPKALADASAAMAKVQQRTAGNVALARRMSPEAARMFLARETEGQKLEVIKAGFADEAKALQRAVADGVIDEQKAKAYQGALREALASGGKPGAVRERLAKDYELHDQIIKRGQAWAEADKDAAGVFSAMQALIKALPAEVDEETGVSVRGSMAKRLAEAQGEWRRTGYPSYRNEQDPAKSLGVLHGLLFDAQAVADPEKFASGFAYGQNPVQITPSGADVVREITGGSNQRGADGVGSTAPREPQERGAKNPAPEPSKAEKPATAKPRRTLQPRKEPGRTAETTEKLRDVKDQEDGKALFQFVAERAAKTMESETDRVAATRALLEAIRTDLGIDPHSPKAMQIVQEAFDKVRGM